MNKSIVWLASYPKSGNTWTRIFLANYFADEDRPLSLNRIDRFGFGDSLVGIYRKIAGNRALDLSDKRVALALRPRVLAAINGNGATVNFVKTHNANTQVFGTELIPPQMTRAAIYILRNPLDVALSGMRHFGMSAEEMVDSMCRSSRAIGGAGEEQVTQYLGSWSDHVQSWSGEARFAVLVTRYEDMLADPAAAFGKMLRHVGIPVDPARLDKAVRFSSFEAVARQEQEEGFKERSRLADRFFVSGQSGKGREALAPELARKLRKQHRKLMQKYGYAE